MAFFLWFNFNLFVLGRLQRVLQMDTFSHTALCCGAFSFFLQLALPSLGFSLWLLKWIASLSEPGRFLRCYSARRQTHLETIFGRAFCVAFHRPTAANEHKQLRNCFRGFIGAVRVPAPVLKQQDMPSGDCRCVYDVWGSFRVSPETGPFSLEHRMEHKSQSNII